MWEKRMNRTTLFVSGICLGAVVGAGATALTLHGKNVSPAASRVPVIATRQATLTPGPSPITTFPVRIGTELRPKQKQSMVSDAVETKAYRYIRSEHSPWLPCGQFNDGQRVCDDDQSTLDAAMPWIACGCPRGHDAPDENALGSALSGLALRPVGPCRRTLGW
jgi:hypothetical protein